MALKAPTQDEWDTAVLWLQSNEGPDEERRRCMAVAEWMDNYRAQQDRKALDRLIRQKAKDAGLPLDKVRAAIYAQLGVKD